MMSVDLDSRSVNVKVDVRINGVARVRHCVGHPAAALQFLPAEPDRTVACSAHTYFQYGTQFPLRQRNSHYGNENSITKRNLHYVYAISNTETQFAL